ncbi:hypothetical protein Droror1_Dr00000177 [Drosera rotundifolia]
MSRIPLWCSEVGETGNPCSIQFGAGYSPRRGCLALWFVVVYNFPGTSEVRFCYVTIEAARVLECVEGEMLFGCLVISWRKSNMGLMLRLSDFLRFSNPTTRFRDVAEPKPEERSQPLLEAWNLHEASFGPTSSWLFRLGLEGLHWPNLKWTIGQGKKGRQGKRCCAGLTNWARLGENLGQLKEEENGQKKPKMIKISNSGHCGLTDVDEEEDVEVGLIMDEFCEDDGVVDELVERATVEEDNIEGLD